MNKFERELLGYIKEIFCNEIDQGLITFRDNSDKNGQEHFIIQEMDSGEFVRKPVNNSKNWMVEIRRKRGSLRDVRVVLEIPDLDIINEADDYPLILRAMAQRAKDILNNPPYGRNISQGSIRPAPEPEYVKFVPRDTAE